MKMYFIEYDATLEWLEPEEYYNEHWSYLAQLRGEDGKVYYIVINNKTYEVRYTNI